MRGLLCDDGGNIVAMLDAISGRVPDATEWLVIHVVDTRGRIDLGMLRSGVAGAGPLAAQHRAEIEAAANERAREVLSAAEAALQARALACAGTFQRRGEPGREICTLAEDEKVDLVVVHARRRPGPAVGPPSVGPTARFVVDHASCPVLVLRGRT